MVFKEVWDAMTKGSILERALVDSEKMLVEAKSMFEDSFVSLVKNDNE